jgi:hypothetical protein
MALLRGIITEADSREKVIVHLFAGYLSNMKGLCYYPDFGPIPGDERSLRNGSLGGGFDNSGWQ